MTTAIETAREDWRWTCPVALAARLLKNSEVDDRLHDAGYTREMIDAKIVNSAVGSKIMIGGDVWFVRAR